MSDEPIPTPGDLTPAQPTDDDEGPFGKTLIDPFTGERIFTPKRAQLIEEDLERVKQERERRKGKQADEQ
jgi:hypothetical protein